MTLLIKNGTIVNANLTMEADVLCQNGKIVEIENNLNPELTSDKIVDASGCYLFPGGIDPHVHMHLPSIAGYSSDDFKSGSLAALYGGTTSIIDFVTPQKGQNLIDALEERVSEANDCLTDYSFHISPVDWHTGIEDEIQQCVEKGFRSFKVYMAYKDSIGLSDEVLFKIMKLVAKAGGMVTVHCEIGDEVDVLSNKLAEANKLSPEYHPQSRPNYIEANAVKRAIDIADRAFCPIYIVHVSCKESLKFIREAQKKGQVVYAETCPQYLILDETKYKGAFEETAKYVMSPPLRSKQDVDELWDALVDGTIQTVGTDHCPFTMSQKEFGINNFQKIPNGAGGVEHRLSLLFTYGVLQNKISLNQFVALTSANAADIFGLSTTKGKIEVGLDADIVIWNPNNEDVISTESHHQNCDINIYDGIKTLGLPEYVIMNGGIVIRRGFIHSDISQGKLLLRS